MKVFFLLKVAFMRFAAHDSWAIASHIALSALTSLFPFLIVVAALAGLAGSGALADEVASLILEAWPHEVAEPIAREARTVLTETRGGVLSISVLLALYFASSGVESLRIGLNRAYGVLDMRPWWATRLESIAYVVAGAFVMLAFAFLVVLGPIIWRAMLLYVPGLQPLSVLVTFVRLGLATILIVGALLLAHAFLPFGRRSLKEIAPGVGLTLCLWLLGGIGFGRYLEGFANAYVLTYAGLATAMVALVFLYLLAAIFLFGGEINAALMDQRKDEVP